MISRIWKISVVLVVGLIIASVLGNNPQPVSLKLGSSWILMDWQIDATLGGVALIAFVAGLSVMAIVALVYAMGCYLREHALKTRVHKFESALENLGRAAGWLAVEAPNRAVALISAILRREKQPICYWALADALIANNDLPAAVNLIAEARQSNPLAPELHLKAAEIQLRASNRAAALEHFRAVIEEFPTTDLFRKTLSLAVELGDEDLAAALLVRIRDLGPDPAMMREIEGDIELLRFQKQIAAVGSETPALIDSLTRMNEEFPTHHKILNTLVGINARAGANSENFRLLLRTSLLTVDLALLYDAVWYGINCSDFDVIIGSLRHAQKKAPETLRLHLAANIARTLVAAHRYDEAEIVLKELDSQLQTLTPASNIEIIRPLRAIIALRSRDQLAALSQVAGQIPASTGTRYPLLPQPQASGRAVATVTTADSNRDLHPHHLSTP